MIITRFGKPVLAATCNNDCMCDGVKYKPICGVDGITYFSPCHAGCNDSVFNPVYYSYVSWFTLVLSNN